jgi:hypothetical protein
MLTLSGQNKAPHFLAERQEPGVKAHINEFNIAILSVSRTALKDF